MNIEDQDEEDDFWERREDERVQQELEDTLETIQKENDRLDWINGFRDDVRGERALLRKLPEGSELTETDFSKAGFGRIEATDGKIVLSLKARKRLEKSLKRTQKTWLKLYNRVKSGIKVPLEIFDKVTWHYYRYRWNMNLAMERIRENEVGQFIIGIFEP